MDIFDSLETIVNDPSKEFKIKTDHKHLLQFISVLTCFNTAAILKNINFSNNYIENLNNFLDNILEEIKSTNKREFEEAKISSNSLFSKFINLDSYKSDEYENKLEKITLNSLEEMHKFIKITIEGFIELLNKLEK